MAPRPFRVNIARAAPATIPIGFPVPLTGPYALEAEDQVRCAQLAVDRFNADGGLDGRRVELLVRDDMLNPAAAAAQTRMLIQSNGVRFIVGSLSATVQLSVARVAAAHGVVYVSISQSDAINEAANTSPLTFHEALNPHMTCEAVGHYVFPRFGKRIAYLIADYTYGHEMARGFKRIATTYGGHTVAEVYHPIASMDFKPFLPKVGEAEPDVLCICNFGHDQLQAMRDAYELGISQGPQIVAPVLLYHQRLSGPAHIFDNVIGATNYHWTLEDRYPMAKAFNDDYRARHGAPPSDYGAYSYSGVAMLLKAMELARSDDPMAVAEVIRRLRYENLKGRQWIRGCDGQSVQSVFVVSSKPATRMTTPHDVFDILHVQTADEKHLRTCAELGY